MFINPMAKPAYRTYSRRNLEALELLAQMIRVSRIDRKMTAQERATARAFLDHSCAGSKARTRVAQ